MFAAGNSKNKGNRGTTKEPPSPLRSSPLLAFFPGGNRSARLSTKFGGVTTVRTSPERLAWQEAAHAAGRTRLGLSPVRADGTCRWGAIDLDAHGLDDAPRLDDALVLAAGLRRLNLTPYLERSRGGRGYHVWLMFEEPGVSVGSLHRLLAKLASSFVHAEAFPSKPRGSGGMLFLPGFGGAPLLDDDLVPVDPRHVELDDPALVIAAVGGVQPSEHWPPRWWSKPAGGGGRGLAALEAVNGLVFQGPDGLTNATSGARNNIAGWMARTIVSRGGDEAAFRRWDSFNQPPLASDEAASLMRWWRWALKKEHRNA